MKGKAITLTLALAALALSIGWWVISRQQPLSPSHKKEPPSIKIEKVTKGLRQYINLNPEYKLEASALEGRSVTLTGTISHLYKKSRKVHILKIKGFEDLKIVVFSKIRDTLTGRGTPLASLVGKQVLVKGIFQDHEIYGFEVIAEDISLSKNNPP